MNAIDYTQLYDLLCNATEVSDASDRMGDWYVLMAARKIAHARFMELAYPPATPAEVTA